METLFYRNKRIFALALGMIVTIGAFTLLSIGRQEDPTITNLFATIVTPYPGADPARVEALVTEKIEDELREIAEIDEINSTSRSGISIVSVELSKFISDDEIEQTWSEIRDALADAAVLFPPGVPEPEFDNDRTGAYTAISAIVPRVGATVNPAILKRYGELLQDRLRGLPDTNHVRLFGEQQEEVLVEIDPRRLASLGLSADQVSAAVARADAKVRAGQVRGVRSDLLIEVAGEIETLDRIREIPIRSGPDGPLLRLSDVATVSRAVRQPAESIAYADGVPAVLVAARMEDDLQVDAWMAKVRTVLSTFEAELPAGLEHRLLFDQSVYTADRLADLGVNLSIGVALVVTILLITLGWRAAMVVATILPLASLLSLSALHQIGIPIQQMSVTGLIVALGLLVDAAIVMTDEIRRRLEQGVDRLEAVRDAVRRLAAPLLASTVTTGLAFMPMALLPGPAGDFVGSIAISVIVMVTASFLLAMTIAPAMAGWTLPRQAEGRRWWTLGVHSKALSGAFRRSLDLALAHPRLAVLGALILPVIGFGAFPTLTAQFFPGVDRDQFYVQVKLAGGASIAETERTALAAGQVIAGQDGVEHVHWVIGESAPSFYYNMIMDRDGVASFAEALVTTASPKVTDRVIPTLQETLDRAFPQAQVIVRGLVQGPPVDAPVELRVVGPDLDLLRALGDDLRRRMAEVPEITHARTTLTGGDPKLIVDLDEDKVRLAGMDLGAVGRQLEATLEGTLGGSLVEGTEELPVRVRVAAPGRASSDAVRALDVVGPDAAARAAAGLYPGVPLSALGTVRLAPSESPIVRRDGERVNTVQGFVALGVLPEEALKTVQVRLAEEPLALPPGYRIEYGGDSDARGETVTNLMASMGLIITFSIATIVLTFNSYRLSLIAGAVTVLSMGLSFLALAVFRYPFGIQGLIGVIGSVGVSINAAIIIMTALKADAGAMAGDLVRMRDVVMGSSRHIVSTTATTFGGFLPLILAGGGFWPPFAMAIAGGVLLSTVVSFYFTPPMFALAMRPRKAKPEAVSGPERAVSDRAVRLAPAVQAA
ncbi:MAG: efflux RND transporter permease subunit [Alphaproteobacteria bacterium]|nr:efflux RND transporter permease subunit [Alphaproteobacteria bacterium]